MAIIVGVDIGGTFTDLVLLDEQDGRVRTAKVPSTPADPSRALLNGLAALEISPADPHLIVHGTTVATNAVLERKGAAVGLIMTEGFRDVLEMRRRDRPSTYGLREGFRPLVPRNLRTEVAERTDFTGRALVRPDPGALRAAAATLLKRGAEAVVVSFINAYANPENETLAAQVLASCWPNSFVVTGSGVAPEIREFERTSTAVLNAYVLPLIAGYLDRLMTALRDAGYRRDVLIFQSNGGVMSQDVARRLPVNTILSGPAAGVAAVCRMSEAGAGANLVSCDVGGTSLDIALVVDGHPPTARDAELDYGLPIRVPMLDIRTIGAGGGSIAWIDRAGLLKIGPQSAGAEPGPACYGMGGAQPTVTDANLVLGRINSAQPIGREAGARLDRDAAAQVIASAIGRPLGLGTEAAAWAILQVTNHTIAAGIRGLTVEQGLDPRDFALVAFGGAGPLHAAALLRELELNRVLVPPWPGITSALGCLTADVRHDFSRSLNQRLDALSLERIYAILGEHAAEGARLIAASGAAMEGVETRSWADMAYDGQIHEVRTRLPEKAESPEELREAFESAYRALFGDVMENRPLRLVTLRTAVVGIRPVVRPQPATAPQGASLEDALVEKRAVYFGEGTPGGVVDPWLETPVYRREKLPAQARFNGPAILEQDDATTVVEPGMTCRMDAQGNLILEAG